jgi:tetratricopeptide (TPR) repeat protein
MLRKVIALLLAAEGVILGLTGLLPGLEDWLGPQLREQVAFLSPSLAAGPLGEFAVLQRVLGMFGALCLLGGWAVARRRPWGRWVAIAASVGNIPLFPFLTVLGLVGLYAFARPIAPVVEEPPDTAAPDDEGIPAERPAPFSHALLILGTLVLVLAFAQALREFARSWGLPVEGEKQIGFLWILAGQFGFLVIHEVGHLLAAWALGFYFREIAFGPVALVERPGGSWGWEFRWPRMLETDAYRRAIPRETAELRLNWIFVVGAGPAASLLVALTGFLGLLRLIGTPESVHWEWAAYLTALGAADFTVNLIPLAGTDGALLLHTALRTRRGRGYLAGLEAAALNDQAQQRGSQMAPARLEETRQQALEQLEKKPDVTPYEKAVQRMDVAAAAQRNRHPDVAAEALAEAERILSGLTGVPDRIWFRYWFHRYENTMARRQYTSAAEARERALELARATERESLDWDERVPIRIACARLWMSEGELDTAVRTIRETRESCPDRRDVTPHAAELLAVEAECKLRTGQLEEAEALWEAAGEVAGALPSARRAAGFELLAQAAIRIGRTGNCPFAATVFDRSVEALLAAEACEVAGECRAAWAEALYENGALEEAQRALAQVPVVEKRLSFEVESLRARLLLAEDRPEDAVAVLTPVLRNEESADGREELLGRARSRALRSWALYRSGDNVEAVEEARKACDLLMPEEHPDAAPALLTLAMAVLGEQQELAEAYATEGGRLIQDSILLTPHAKTSRLTDLARGAVQANRKEWAKLYLELANHQR